jgi:chromate transporter
VSTLGTLGVLAGIYGELSLLAVGGGNTILPEMKRQVVDVQGWMTGPEFAALYALAQASPGPNMLVSTLSLCAPSCLLTFFTAGAWYRFRHAEWRRRVQRGLVPLTVGLLMAGAAVLCEATVVNWQNAAVTVLVTVAFLYSRINPLWLMAGGAALGVMGLL